MLARNFILIAEFSNLRFIQTFLVTLHDWLCFSQQQKFSNSRLLIYRLFLFISFQIPIHFDILSYLKKAWCSGRLVLTIPWAVEYLSMMDPVAPLLDYFSVVLNFLYRIYRFLHSSLLTKEINAQIEKTRKTFLFVVCIASFKNAGKWELTLLSDCHQIFFTISPPNQILMSQGLKKWSPTEL